MLMEHSKVRKNKNKFFINKTFGHLTQAKSNHNPTIHRIPLYPLFLLTAQFTNNLKFSESLNFAQKRAGLATIITKKINSSWQPY